MMFRILQISPQVPFPPIDGGKISIYGLLKFFSEAGHKVDFVCYRKHSDLNISKNELSKFCVPHILDIQTDNNIFNAFLNLFSNKPYNVSKYIRKELLDYIKSYFRENNPDIIHIDHIHMAWIVENLRQFTNVPIVLREHNFESDIIFRTYSTRKFLLTKSYLYLQYKRLLKFETSYAEKFDKVIMISETDEKKILNYNPNIKTLAIPAGVNENLFLYNAYNNQKIPNSIFHIGSLEWLPNLDGLQWFVDEVLPIVVDKYPQTKLFVYGKFLEKLYVPDKLKNNIIKVGFVENLWDEIKDKLIGIIPLRVGSGIRIKILELLAQGHFIISTSVGREGIQLNDAEHFLEADDRDNFAEKIIKTFKNEYNYKQICITAQNLMKEKYSWKIVGREFEKVYSELINKKF